MSECFASVMLFSEKAWNAFRKSHGSSWHRFSSATRVRQIRGVMRKEGMLPVYQINTFLYAVLQQAQAALQQQDIQRFVCDAVNASRQGATAERSPTAQLLSALPFNRQLKGYKPAVKIRLFLSGKCCVYL